MIKELIAVGLGGFAGTALRYLANQFIPGGWTATLTVNLAGCFLIGFFGALAANCGAISRTTALTLTVGLCGGLTTFSTFTKEMVNMADSGNIGAALLYPAASIALGAVLFLAGRFLANTLAN